VKNLLEPISESNPVGEDPRYLDNFVALKAEIEKKEEVDYKKIDSLAKDLLKEEAKDLRVSSYYALAASRLRGIAGLFEGMELILGLVEAYPDQIFPIKEKIRKSSILWLHQPKTIVFAKKDESEPSFDDVCGYVEMYGQYCERMSAYTGDNVSWPDLKKWLDDLTRDLKPADKPAENTEVKKDADAPVTAPSNTSGSVSTGVSGASVSSAGQFQTQQRLLIRYCKEQKQYGKMVALSRALMFGELIIPPNESGKTRIPVPNMSGVNRVKTLVDSGQWLEGFIAAEETLLENGSLFLFEIQKLSYECALKASLNDVAHQIRSSFVSLLDRYPKLAQLTFDSGDLFMSGSAAAWLDSLKDEPTQGSGSGESGYKELLSDARKQLMESSLKEALAWVREQTSVNELTNSYKSLASAQLCVEAERVDLALPLLQQLDLDIESRNLDGFLPDFCMQVWKNLYFIEKNELLNSKEKDTSEIESRLNRYKSRLCTTDITQAMGWI